jgi:hypothetical protein
MRFIFFFIIIIGFNYSLIAQPEKNFEQVKVHYLKYSAIKDADPEIFFNKAKGYIEFFDDRIYLKNSTFEYRYWNHGSNKFSPHFVFYSCEKGGCITDLIDKEKNEFGQPFKAKQSALEFIDFLTKLKKALAINYMFKTS